MRRPAGLDLAVEEGVAVAGHERSDGRMLGHIGLDQAVAFDRLAPGAPSHLAQQLEGALRSARVRLRETEVGIDHADQSKPREVMALSDELGADDDIDLARLDLTQGLTQ